MFILIASTKRQICASIKLGTSIPKKIIVTLHIGLDMNTHTL